MIIWRGWGVLAAPLALVGAFLGGLLHKMGLPFRLAALLGFLLGAGLIWWVGTRLNDPAKARMMVDAKTGESVLLRSRHDLFWIPLQWWAIPVGLFAFFMAFFGK